MIVKKIDGLGRLGIPKSAMESLGWKKEEFVEMIPDEKNDALILKKVDRCLVCGAREHLIAVKEPHFICKSCLAALR